MCHQTQQPQIAATSPFHQSNLRSSAMSSPAATKQRVRFAASNSVCPTASPLEQLLDWSPVWFTEQEQIGFRVEAARVCLQLRKTRRKNQLTLAAADGSSRGLEQRACPQRQRRAYLCRRLVTTTQHELKKGAAEEQLAALSRKWTSWATTLAIQEASRDFLRAYHGELVVESRRKRLVSGAAAAETDARCVRRRLSCAVLSVSC